MSYSYLLDSLKRRKHLENDRKSGSLAQQAAQRFDEAGVFGLFNQDKIQKRQKTCIFQGSI